MQKERRKTKNWERCNVEQQNYRWKIRRVKSWMNNLCMCKCVKFYVFFIFRFHKYSYVICLGTLLSSKQPYKISFFFSFILHVSVFVFFVSVSTFESNFVPLHFVNRPTHQQTLSFPHAHLETKLFVSTFFYLNTRR